MPLNFPSSPTNGQVYEQYIYDSSNGVWQLSRPSSDKTPTIAVVSGASVSPTYDGTAAVYSFTSNGNIIIESAGYADILLVGGGGSGGIGAGGGGGAGGHLYIENAYLPSGSLDVVIGAGGVSYLSNVNGSGALGYPGLPSRLGPYFVPGGAGGGGFSATYNSTVERYLAGQSGASGGGGAGYTNNSGGSGVFGIGNSGGSGGASDGGGGGGGAAASGSAGVSTTGGAGGSGVLNSITGTATTRAGGGGGGGSTGGAGGSGGGGAGTSSTNGVNGIANTGGGGGGLKVTLSGIVAGNGGSGIVIVRINS